LEAKVRVYSQSTENHDIAHKGRAHYFVPRNEFSALYGQTTQGGCSHAWKMTVNASESGSIGLRGGYEQGRPLDIASNNPGIIEFSEPPRSVADRTIKIVGKKPGFTILDAIGATGQPWCSLQVEVLGQLYTPAIPQWRLYQMSWDYYRRLTNNYPGPDPAGMLDREFCQKWSLREDEFRNLLGIFRRSQWNRAYWQDKERPSTGIQLNDFLVIGEGGVVTLNSAYGDVILGRKLRELRPPSSAIGSLAGAVARIFTNDKNLIGAIEASGDLIEIGLSGFAVARMNADTLKAVPYPTRTIQQRRVVGNLFRDQVAEAARQMHEGTGYTVETEEEFQTEQGARFGDVVLRNPRGKIVCVFECKTGSGASVKEQVRKDHELYVDKDIRTIKVTPDFLFLPE
jgi:hypothetical protein